MKINIKFLFILFGLIIIVLALEEKQITKITITTTKDELEEEEQSSQKNKTNKEETEKKEKESSTVIPPIHYKYGAESTVEKMIEEAKRNAKETTKEKVLTLTVPYQDNEDYIICPMGFGSPVNFVPLQIETTSYKTWVLSALNENNPSIFNYNIKESKTGEETGDWDTVVDEEGTVSGNVIYDTSYIGKYKIEKFKFMEGVEFEDEFKDYRIGKLGLGNCQYAQKEDKEYCLLQRLKDNGSIDRRIFSLKELTDTHGEIVIGDITKTSKEKDFPLLNVVNEEIYDDIEDDEFKMSWLTKVSHVLFRNNNENIKKIFDNNIHLIDGLASFDSSCHYIEAPYSYIDAFEEQMFDLYYDNACRKVNRDGTYMFLCQKDRYEKIKDKNKALSFIIVMNGYGYEIPMDFLFEQTSADDYEFFVHFKDYEQNIWNLGHPFFHHYTIIFDQDNQEIGIDGKLIYNLQDETEAALKKKKSGSFWKIFFLILLGLLLLIGLFYIARKIGIQKRLDRGVDASLVDNEDNDDLSFNPGQNIN